MSQPSSARARRARSPGAVEEEERQYGGPIAAAELDDKYPRRPHNHSRTLAFSELPRTLFNPLNENKKQAGGTGPGGLLGGGGGGGGGGGRGRAGGGGKSARLSPHEQRRLIIERFMRRWRAEVGDDIYPALRLILPDKDRDRGMYGLKESAVGKLLVKLTKIDKNSDDGYALLHWKLPGNVGGGGGGGGYGYGGGGAEARLLATAGDFATRCYDVLAKRALRTGPGDMRIGEVNALLDQLSAASGEAEQLPIFERFYAAMSAEEMMWLVRIVLRQMKVGATERTFLDLWHPDAEALFGVSSSLRRVCWELWDPAVRLDQGGAAVALMSCFQPQLAQFQTGGSFARMVQYLGPTQDDPEFWIEEKLDGERMQMHMVTDEAVEGGRRFAFWSRKAKDYTYLYGSGYHDERSALTRHLRHAFDPNVRNLILDGEMITWDMELDRIVPFGTLKTAALAERNNPGEGDDGDDKAAGASQKDGGGSWGGQRPLFRVFDLLYLNDQALTRYTLRDRHRALTRAVVGAPRRLEIHEHVAATSADEVEPLLRRVVADSSEGLVLKNPRSTYRLNSRNDDWLKVKPEYMAEFGESLDCVVIGGYYGSGKRGGRLSSFLLGLRVGENAVRATGLAPEHCLSFFKVGGGMRAEDYAAIRHHTDGLWTDWDAAAPPSEYITLAGGDRVQAERPDVWIRPSRSVVLECKAASVGPSDSFATGLTLRFPRFRRLRTDKAWDQALDVDGFRELRQRAEAEHAERAMDLEDHRRHRRKTAAGGGPNKRAKKELTVVGGGPRETSEAGSDATTRSAAREDGRGVFAGLEFAVLSEALPPHRRTKAQLEALLKQHGGRVTQRAEVRPGLVLVADKNVVKVAGLVKRAQAEGGGGVDIVRPGWILDCLKQPGKKGSVNAGGTTGQLEGFRLPYETAHLLHATPARREAAAKSCDRFGDSYARDVEATELRELLDAMAVKQPGDDDEMKVEDDDSDDDKPSVPFDKAEFLAQLDAHGHDVLAGLRGAVFRQCVVQFAGADGCDETTLVRLRNYVRFGGGAVVAAGQDWDSAASLRATHVVVLAAEEDGGSVAQRETAATVRNAVSGRPKKPRIVTGRWVVDCWKESTLLDEEMYAPM